jgi:hypothetical protein
MTSSSSSGRSRANSQGASDEWPNTALPGRARKGQKNAATPTRLTNVSTTRVRARSTAAERGVLLAITVSDSALRTGPRQTSS